MSSGTIDDLVDGELKKWFRDFVDEVRKIRKLRKKMGSSSTSSATSAAGPGLTTPPSNGITSQTVVPPLAGLGMLEVVGVHEDLLESTARPGMGGINNVAKEIAELATLENTGTITNSTPTFEMPAITIGDSDAPPPLICVDPTEGNGAGDLILLVDASGKAINDAQQPAHNKNNNFLAGANSMLMTTTNSVLGATVNTANLGSTINQLAKPLNTAKRTVSFLEGSRSEFVTPRTAGRSESVGLETKLGSAIKDMSRKEIENSLEQAVRLIFELIKATNRSGSLAQAAGISDAGSRRTSLGLNGRKDSKLKMRSSLTKHANSNSGEFSLPSKSTTSRSTTPRTFGASHSKTDEVDFHACVDDDFADFEDERAKARQARAAMASQAAAQMVKVQQQMQQFHNARDDDTDSTVSSEESGGGVNHARATARQLAVSESLDIDDLMGSQSLEDTDLKAFVEHNNLKREKDSASGNIIINDYVVLGNLGQGAYGKVKLAHLREDPKKLVAIKIINKSLTKKQGAFKQGATSESQIRREIAIMKKLRHRNIVSLHSVVDDPEAEKMYMVMDYIGGGTVLKDETDAAKKAQGFLYIPIPESTAVGYLRQLVDGLRHMHKHGIAHRDIKPANILLNANRIYISDFGVSELCDPEESSQPSIQPTKAPSFVAFGNSPFATALGNSRTSTDTQQYTQRDDQPFASTPNNQRASVSVDTPVSPMRVKGHKGTPLFWPPEMFTSDPESEGFHDGEMQDLWALGVTLFMMLTGKAPFTATAFAALKKEVTSHEAVALPDSLSHKARFLLKSMLNKDPNERPGLLDIRHHPFLGGYDKRTAVDRGSIFVYSTELDEEAAITVASGAVLPTKYLIAKVKPVVMRKIYRIREKKRLKALEEEKRASVDRSTSGHTGGSNTDSNNSTTTAPAIGASTNSTAVMMSPGTDQLTLTPKGDTPSYGRSPVNPTMGIKTLSNRSNNANGSFNNMPLTRENTNPAIQPSPAARAPIISDSTNFPTPPAPGDMFVVTRPSGLVLPTLNNIDVFVTQEVGPRRGSVQDSPDTNTLANSQQNSVSGAVPAGVSMNPRRTSVGPSPPNSHHSSVPSNQAPASRPRKVSITDSTFNSNVGTPTAITSAHQPLPIMQPSLYEGSRLVAANPYAGGSRVGFWRTGSNLNHINTEIVEAPAGVVEQQPSPTVPQRAVSPMLQSGKGNSPASPMVLRPPTPTSHGQRTALLQAENASTGGGNLFQPRQPIGGPLAHGRLGNVNTNLLAAPVGAGAYGSFSIGARPAALSGVGLYTSNGLGTSLSVPTAHGGAYLSNAARANSSLPGLIKPINGASTSSSPLNDAAHLRKPAEPLGATINSLNNTSTSLSPGSRVRNRLSNALMLNTTEE